MKTLFRKLRFPALAVLMATGMLLAYSITRPPAASAHVGNATFDCVKGVMFTFTSFANANGNTVHVWVKKDGVVVYQHDYTWNGMDFTSPWVDIGLDGAKHNVEAGGSWDTNGHQGSFDTGYVPLDCSKPCQPVTVTITVATATTTVNHTTTVPSTVYSTTTAPGSTIHDTTTVNHTTTVPTTTNVTTTNLTTTNVVSTATVTNNVVSTATVTNNTTTTTQGQTVHDTTTATTPGQTVTHTVTVIKKVPVRPKKHVSKPPKRAHFTPYSYNRR